MYTSNNRAVHAYEDALNGLLECLDAVDSQGDHEIRGRRKEVVKEVERALRDIERRVEESRERSRERGCTEEARHVSFSVPILDATPQLDASPVTNTDLDVPTAAPTADDSSEAKDAPARMEETAEAQVEPAPTVEESVAKAVTEAVPTPAHLPTEAPAVLSHAAEDQAVPAVMVGEQEMPSALETTGAPIQDTSRPDASPTTEEQVEVELPLELLSSSTDAAVDSTTSEVPEAVPQSAPILPDTPERSCSAHPDASADASFPTGTSAVFESWSDAFLLSSHPLQGPARKTSSESTSQEGEEAEIVTHAEADGDNSSEWSEVDA